VGSLAADASASAADSQRVISTIVRALAQQQNGSAAVDVLLDGRDAGSLIYQLGTLDKLSHLTGNVQALRERAEADQKRADTLLSQQSAAQQLVASIPLAGARAELDAARAAFDVASSQLDTLRSSATAGLLELSPLPALDLTDTGQLSNQGWAAPAIGTITDVFGPRPSLPLPGVGAFHYGTDIGAACGAGIYAATSGVVVAASPLGTYGNWILIDHGDGIQTGYGHVADGETLVAVGESVIAGQVIAGVGSTGASTGCHLHFEVRINGNRVDAQPFMAQRGVILGESVVLPTSGADQ
jgi:murein DD-endopeptidase MepM/ murein hydrolase activator NlpD